MFISQWLKAASVVVVAGATVAGVDVVVLRGTSGAQARPGEKAKAAGTAVHEVKPGKLTVNVIERGRLESSDNRDAYCNVEGSRRIVKIVPEGTRVEKGQIVCELDPTDLPDRLINQRITTEAAKAIYQNAKLAREVAEIAVIEYTEGIYKSDLNAVKGEIAAARSSVQKAENRLERTRRARTRLSDALLGKAETPAAIVVELDLDDRLESAEQTLLLAKNLMDLAKAKGELLEKYTKNKMVRQLEGAVEKARSDELAKEATWELQTMKQQKLERQIAACTLKAPSDGFVVYFNNPGREFGNTLPRIEEGATVRERQKIISIPDLGRMQVNAKIHESLVDQIAPRMKVEVRVDAFSDHLLKGTVLDLAPRPDPRRTLDQDVGFYTAHIKIDDPLPGLRPGMTAQADILVKELDNVLSVPTSAVVHYDDKDHLAVKTPEGRFEWREVALGMSNGLRVEVKKGLRDGEVVVLDPLSLLSEQEKREKFGAPPRPTPPAK